MNTPPKFFLRFFRWFCNPELRNSIEGDITELYNERVIKSGKRKADLKFAADVLLLLRPGIIKSSNESQSINHFVMYKSYFKIGWRNLLKNKGYSVINIGGLALGMAVVLVIALWVYDELSFNKSHDNYDRIAQVMKGGQYRGKYYVGQKHLPFPIIDELKTNYSTQFKHVVPVSGPGGWSGVLTVQDKMRSEEHTSE